LALFESSILSNSENVHQLNKKYKKSPANVNGNTQQRCMFESPVKQSLSQSPEGARRLAAKYLVFHWYSPEGPPVLLSQRHIG